MQLSSKFTRGYQHFGTLLFLSIDRDTGVFTQPFESKSQTARHLMFVIYFTA